jgi:hypothetical protein
MAGDHKSLRDVPFLGSVLGYEGESSYCSVFSVLAMLVVEGCEIRNLSSVILVPCYEI